MSTLFALFFLLLFGHALADFALQSEQMRKDKHRKENPFDWWIVLGAHSFIHGGVVAIFLGSPLLGFFESCAHFCIDFGKCEGWYGFRTDQALHVFCKLLWIGCFVVGIR